MRIVVADDSRMWRTILKDFLISKGHEVEVANDGLDAYFKVYENIPDALISDVVMPGLNGYQLCRILKRDQDLSELPVILMTASTDSLDKFWSKYSGADAYIKKDSKNGLEEMNSMLDEIQSEIHDFDKVDSKNGKSIFGRTLDKLLVETTLKAEIRKLSSHVEDMNYTMQKMNLLLESIFEAEATALLTVSVDEISLYTSLSDPQEVEKTMLSYLSRPYFPTARSYMNLDGLESSNGLEHIHGVALFDSNERGAISIWRGKSFSTREKEMLSLICEEFGGILKIGLQLNDYRKNAYFDELTGIANFRSLEEHLQKLWEDGKNFSLSMMDIDNFKKVNDTYGHAVGNEVLTGIGRILKDVSKKFDIFVGRFGGEEFLLISDKMNASHLYKVTDHVRKEVEKSHLSESVLDLVITISGGVSQRSTFKSFTEVIEGADKGLYHAKRKGRNLVITL